MKQTPSFEHFSAASAALERMQEEDKQSWADDSSYFSFSPNQISIASTTGLVSNSVRELVGLHDRKIGAKLTSKFIHRTHGNALKSILSGYKNLSSAGGKDYSYYDDIFTGQDNLTTPNVSKRTARPEKTENAPLMDRRQPAPSIEGTMTDISRDELDRKIASLEERMDKRLERLEKAEDLRARAYHREQRARDKLFDERFQATFRRLDDRDLVIDSKLDKLRETVNNLSNRVVDFDKQLTTKLDDIKSSNRNAGWAMLAIAVGAVIGIWGANSTIVGSASGIFQSGMESSKSQLETERILKEANLILQSMQAELKRVSIEQEDESTGPSGTQKKGDTTGIRTSPNAVPEPSKSAQTPAPASTKN